MEPGAKEKSMKINKSLRNRIIEDVIIYLSPILGGIVFFILQEFRLKGLFVQTILSLAASCAFSLFLRSNHSFYRNRIRHPVYFFGCYLLSFLWLGLSGSERYGCLWFLLVIFAALDAGAEIAVFSEMLLMLSYAVITMYTTINFRYYITYFVLGLVMTVLFSVLRRWWEAGYLLLILVFFDAACRIFIYDFSVGEFFKNGQVLIQEFISILALTLVGVFYVTFLSPGIRVERILVQNRFVRKTFDEHKETEELQKSATRFVRKTFDKHEETEETKETQKSETIQKLKEIEILEETENLKKSGAVETEHTEDKPVLPDFVKTEPEKIETEIPENSIEIKTKKQKNTKLSAETKILQKLLQPDFPLAKRMKQFSAALYRHSKKISILSGGAAKLVGSDELLARAGGFYHEIGRITPSRNYILAGEKIAKEAGFPSSLISVIRHHSPLFELPETREAAVVMLSDSIVSTEEYLIKNGQRSQITDKQLVENIFQKRISKGNLDEVDFTSEELEALKKYYMKNLSSIEQ